MFGAGIKSQAVKQLVSQTTTKYLKAKWIKIFLNSAWVCQSMQFNTVVDAAISTLYFVLHLDCFQALMFLD
jgi:hypothetical protein